VPMEYFARFCSNIVRALVHPNICILHENGSGYSRTTTILVTQMERKHFHSASTGDGLPSIECTLDSIDRLIARDPCTAITGRASTHSLTISPYFTPNFVMVSQHSGGIFMVLSLSRGIFHSFHSNKRA